MHVLEGATEVVVLRAVEWEDVFGNKLCSYCVGRYPKHSEDCALKTELGEDTGSWDHTTPEKPAIES